MQKEAVGIVCKVQFVDGKGFKGVEGANRVRPRRMSKAQNLLTAPGEAPCASAPDEKPSNSGPILVARKFKTCEEQGRRSPSVFKTRAYREALFSVVRRAAAKA